MQATTDGITAKALNKVAGLLPRRSFSEGDYVVYSMTKHTTRPGPRARDIQAAAHGDNYRYCVDKFWVVVEVLGEGEQLVLQTRRGKRHVLDSSDPQLRHAMLWDRIRYGTHFPPPLEANCER